jgi:putative membrane protein
MMTPEDPDQAGNYCRCLGCDFVVPHITLKAHGLHKIETLVVVAIIFGLINAVLKPIVKAIGCWAYAITFGLIAIVVNGLLFWLASWVAGKLHEPFHIQGIIAAVFGGLVVGIVSWVLTLIVDRDDATDSQATATTRRLAVAGSPSLSQAMGILNGVARRTEPLRRRSPGG